MTKVYEQSVKTRIAEEKLATEFIKATGDLFYDKGVETVLFRNQVIDKRASEILSLHDYSRKFVGKNITIQMTVALLNEVLNTDICPSRFDIGRLAAEYVEEGSNFKSMSAFVTTKLAEFIGIETVSEAKDVVLYGFGRIGRLVARELIAQEGKGNQLRLRAIVVRGDVASSLEKRASLLRIDTVHGAFPGTVEADVENECLIIDGRPVNIISANAPEDIDYQSYGINDALVIDNTGAFRDEEALGRHLKAKGIAKVLSSA